MVTTVGFRYWHLLGKSLGILFNILTTHGKAPNDREYLVQNVDGVEAEKLSIKSQFLV